MKIKGRTIIELTDVRTGKVQRFEDNNAFMDSNIEAKFRNFGIFRTSVLENFANTPLWQKLCGGLLLLDSVVDSNANFVALGQKMTGRGYYGSSNNGSPVNLGSWNATESAVSSNAVQMVYDFTTSQGNGDIKAVCLTSDYCGRIGLGNQADDTNLSLRVQPLTWGGANTTFNLTNIGYAFDGDYIYCNPVLDGTSLTIDKRYANAKKVDLIHTLTGTYKAGTISVTLPSALTYTNNIRLMQASKTKLVLIGYPNSGFAFSVAVIDISTSTPTATVCEVTDMPALTDQYGGYIYQFADVIGVNASNQPLIVVGATDWKPRAVVVNAVTGAKQAFLFDTRWTEWTGENYRVSAYTMPIGNGFFIIHSTANVSAPGFVCDTSTGSIHPCECCGNIARYINGLDLLAYNDTSWIRLCQNPFYLATINNLATPVTKTSSQTMKVTYVISRANS